MRRVIATAGMTVLFLVALPAWGQQKPLTFEDGKTLVRGTLMMSEPGTGRIFVMKDSAAQMPAFDPLSYYAGDDKSGHPIVWMNKNPVGTYVGKTFASMAGGAFAAMDHGYAGPEWKARYDVAAAADNALATGAADPFAHRRALLTELDVIYKTRSQSQEQAAKNDLAWIRRTLHAGMLRGAAYAALKQRGLVAYNTAYDPGTPTAENGCSWSGSPKGEWPVMNQAVPQRVGPCAMFGQAKRKKNPEVYLSWDAGFTVACTTRTTLELDFTLSDKLMALKKPVSQQDCY